ncbi:MAG: hypothetical protein K0R26_2146 [Bacteroidota bacterium]|jgi:hypothetical protein|nr:hypothetical protein [Bacteroidota bacterium]
METHNLILVTEFCTHHDIERSFIDQLSNLGLIEIVNVENSNYLNHDQLKDLERLVRLHYELDINIEGIDVITRLLERIASLETQLKETQNKLRFFDSL